MINMAERNKGKEKLIRLYNSKVQGTLSLRKLNILVSRMKYPKSTLQNKEKRCTKLICKIEPEKNITILVVISKKKSFPKTLVYKSLL